MRNGTFFVKNNDDVITSALHRLRHPPSRVDAELELIHLIHQRPEIAKYCVAGASTVLHHVCFCRCSLPTVKTVYNAYPAAIGCNNGNGSPLHVACRRNAPMDVVSFLIRTFPEANDMILNGTNANPLSLAIQYHAQRLHLLPLFLSNSSKVATLGPLRFDWTQDHHFLLDGLKAYSKVCRPDRVSIRCVAGRISCSMSLSIQQQSSPEDEARDKERDNGIAPTTLHVDLWILSSLLEETLLLVGRMDLPLRELDLGFFEEPLDHGLIRGLSLGWNTLERLDITRCKTNCLGELLNSLADKPKLRRVHLLRLDEQNADCLQDLYRLKHLEHLELSWIPFRAGSPLTPLTRLLHSTDKLECLGLRLRDLALNDFVKLTRALAGQKTVTRLELDGIPRDGTEHLWRVMEEGNWTLKSVDIGPLSRSPSQDRDKVAYYAALNKAGRERVQQTQTTYEQIILDLVAPVSNDVSVVFGLLRSNPPKWSQQLLYSR